MTMTLAELLADLEAQLEDGADPATPVLIAVQPCWAPVHELAGLAAVYGGEDREGGRGTWRSKQRCPRSAAPIHPCPHLG